MSSDSIFWHDPSITIKYPTWYLPHTNGKIDPRALANNAGKLKLYCVKCFDAHIAEIQVMEQGEYSAGRRANPPRERSEIEAECECKYFLDT